MADELLTADRLHQVNREIDAGLDGYLKATGRERQALTIKLMRLRDEKAQLESLPER